ncbi:hypothetical protein DB347_25210 [Opitutaceae bacterium EW11]|nr:hypothetical protein DB347_25210 [Opitutaceae bacterium EW11]
MKLAVRRILREWDESLHLTGTSYWGVSGIGAPVEFFQNLPLIFPHGFSLLLEGIDVGRTAKSLYAEHPAKFARKVACDTLSPEPDSFHVEFSPLFAQRLSALIEQQGRESAFRHLKGYSPEEVLFTFHDAFEGELVVSSSVAEVAVSEFALASKASFSLKQFEFDPHTQLVALDKALNPPWWARLMRRLRLTGSP